MKTKLTPEIIDDCIQRVVSGQETLEDVVSRYPGHADELRLAVEAALWLHRRQQAVAARPGYVSASRKRLVEQISRQHPAAPAQKRWFAWLRPATFRWALTTLTVLFVLATFWSGAQAMARSLPGDPLYNWKLAVEDLQLVLTRDPVAKAQLRIGLAEQQFDDIQTLMAQGRYEDVPATLDAYQQNLTAVEQLIAGLPEGSADQRQLARKLSTTVNDHTQALRAFNTLAQVPDDVAAVIAISIARNEETFSTLIILMEKDGGQERTLPGTSTVVVPGLTDTHIPPANTPKPTATAYPTQPEPTGRPPTNTPRPEPTGRPPTNTPRPEPTRKPPTNTPRPEPTRKPPTNTPRSQPPNKP